MRFKPSNVTWGICLLLVAAFLIVNQLSDFTVVGIGSIIAIILALAFIVQCLARLHFAPLPIPLAVLYAVLQTPLALPAMQIWQMILPAVIAYVGLEMLLPKPKKRRHPKCRRPHVSVKDDDSNNPSVSVSFGATSRHLRAEALETAWLNCSFGGMEIFLDGAELNPNGAELVINCSFGAVQLVVPRHWQIIDRVNCSVGGVDIEKSFSGPPPAENAPRLTLSGKVSFGGVEVRQV